MAQKGLNITLFCLYLGSLLLASHGASVPVATPPACSTPACQTAAKYLLASLNTSVSPCDNFDAYACGGWQSTHTIPETQDATGTFYVAMDRLASDLMQILGQFSLASAANSSDSVKFAAYIHQQCIALGKAPAEVGLAHLKPIVKRILGKDWSIGRHSESHTQGASWKESFIRAFLAGVSTILDINLSPNLENVTQFSVSLAPTPFPLGDIELQNLTKSAKDVAIYKEVIAKSAGFFCEGKCNQSLLSQDIDDIINLESQLALHKASPTESRDFTKAYQMVPIQHLQDRSHYNFFNSILVPLLQSLGLPANTVNPARNFTILDVNYTVNAFTLLATTPTRTLLNYIGWRTVRRYGAFSSESIRQIHFTLSRAVFGLKKMTPREEFCSQVANAVAPMAVSRLFVDKHFTRKGKEAATQMINSLQESLTFLLQSNSWLDAETKNASLWKLSHVKKNIAYPEWMLSNDKLDTFYNLKQNSSRTKALLSEGNYLLSIATFSALQLKDKFANFEAPVDFDKNWAMQPALINAGYYFFQNSINIPAAILRSPFFDSERPFSLNYGSLGYLLGHEFTHGLDDAGSQFDEYGNRRNWWSAEAAKRSKEKSQCFVEQYSSIVEPISGMHLNGRNGLGENIADNGGLREAFHAFQSRQTKSGRSPTLAALPQFTSEQLFFLSFANTWCTLITKEGLTNQILYDAHSPNKYRINVPLSNSPDFAKAFNCPVGSPMNPIKKCQLW